MKAKLKADGTLTVTAETETERFALKRWGDDYFCEEGNPKPVSFSIDYGEETTTTSSDAPGNIRIVGWD